MNGLTEDESEDDLNLMPYAVDEAPPLRPDKMDDKSDDAEEDLFPYPVHEVYDPPNLNPEEGGQLPPELQYAIWRRITMDPNVTVGQLRELIERPPQGKNAVVYGDKLSLNAYAQHTRVWDAFFKRHFSAVDYGVYTAQRNVAGLADDYTRLLLWIRNPGGLVVQEIMEHRDQRTYLMFMTATADDLRRYPNKEVWIVPATKQVVEGTLQPAMSPVASTLFGVFENTPAFGGAQGLEPFRRFRSVHEPVGDIPLARVYPVTRAEAFAAAYQLLYATREWRFVHRTNQDYGARRNPAFSIRSCFVCAAIANESACGGCGAVPYCSDKCADDHWFGGEHWKTCNTQRV